MKKLLLSAACLLALSPGFAQITYTHVECGTEFTLAVRSDSTLWACGVNSSGQLASTTLAGADTLVPVMPGQKWLYAATGALHGLAIATDSTLWAWGLNGNGQLGTGTTSDAALPAQVSPTAHWRYVSGGEGHTVAIRNDGTLWATGFNQNGELGTGDTVQQLSFVQIGTATDWKTVSAGGVFNLAIKNDGTLWGWGYNGDGELGLNNTVATYLVPTQIGTATDWAMVGAGFEFSLAMKTDGTAWSSGFNGNGQLGRATTGYEDSVFTQIGTATNWKFITAGASFALGIRQDGTLWGWGYNSYGQLGLAAASTEVVTQVGTDANWQFISAADGFISGSSVYGLHSAGFKTTASGLCTTGADYAGQLGNSETIATPSAQFAFDCSVGDVSLAVTNITNTENIITVYPNPAFESLHIDGMLTTADYRITNMLGTVVVNGLLQKGTNELSIQSLVPGVYTVIVTSTNGLKYTTRFVKQ